MNEKIFMSYISNKVRVKRRYHTSQYPLRLGAIVTLCFFCFVKLTLYVIDFDFSNKNYIWAQEVNTMNEKREQLRAKNAQIELEIAQAESLTRTYDYARKHGFTRVKNIVVVKTQ